MPKKTRKTDSGNSRNTNSLIMGEKGVAGTFGTGPAEFRARQLGRMHGFKQAKDVTSQTGKISHDPTPRQQTDPPYQRWQPREKP